MKKFISFVLVLLLVTVSACAQTPDFLKQGINYTADYNVTLTFENPQVVKELMEEFDASKPICPKITKNLKCLWFQTHQNT